MQPLPNSTSSTPCPLSRSSRRWQVSGRDRRRSTAHKYACPNGTPKDAAVLPKSARCDSGYAACVARKVCRRVPWLLLLLAFLAENVFARIFHAFAFVRLRRAVAANFSGNLPNLLLVDARHSDGRGLLA